MAAGGARPAAIVNRPVPVVRREPVRAVAPPSQPGSAASPASPGSNDNLDQPNGDSLDEDNDQRVPDVEDGPVHRQLIRATLPRIEGHKEERRPTDFTIRQPGGRGSTLAASFAGAGAVAAATIGCDPAAARQAAAPERWRPGASRQRSSADRRAPVCPAPVPVRGRGRATVRARARGQGGGFNRVSSSHARVVAAGNVPGSRPHPLRSSLLFFRRVLCLNALQHAGRVHAALSRLVARAATVRLRDRAGTHVHATSLRFPRAAGRSVATSATHQVPESPLTACRRLPSVRPCSACARGRSSRPAPSRGRAITTRRPGVRGPARSARSTSRAQLPTIRSSSGSCDCVPIATRPCRRSIRLVSAPSPATRARG